MEPGRDRFPKTGIFCLTWASNFELPTKKCFLGRRRLSIPYTWGLLQKCHDKMMHSGFFSKICLTFPKISTRYARKCDGNFRAIKAATQGFEMSLRSFVLKMFNTSHLRIRTLEWFFIEGHSSMFFVVKIEMMVVCSTFLFLWRGTSTWQTFILLVEKAQYLHLRLFFPTKSSEFVDIRDETNDAENGEVFLDWRLEIWCSWSRWPKISERKTSLISKSSECSIKQKYLVEFLSSSNFPSPFLHGKKKEKETKMVRIAQVDF